MYAYYSSLYHHTPNPPAPNRQKVPLKPSNPRKPRASHNQLSKERHGRRQQKRKSQLWHRGAARLGGWIPGALVLFFLKRNQRRIQKGFGYHIFNIFFIYVEGRESWGGKIVLLIGLLGRHGPGRLFAPFPGLHQQHETFRPVSGQTKQSESENRYPLRN